MVDKRKAMYRHGIWGYGDTEIGSWGVWEWEWITEMPEGGVGEEKGSRRTYVLNYDEKNEGAKEGRGINEGRKT